MNYQELSKALSELHFPDILDIYIEAKTGENVDYFDLFHYDMAANMHKVDEYISHYNAKNILKNMSDEDPNE